MIVALALASLLSVAKADVLHDVLRGFAAQSDLRAAYAKGTFDTIPTDLQVDRALALPSHMHGLAFVLVPPVATAPSPVLGMDVVVASAVPQIALAYDRVFTINDALDRYEATPIPDVSSGSDATLPHLNSLVELLPPVALSSPVLASPGTLDQSDVPQQAAFAARLQDASIAIPAPVSVGAFKLAATDTTSDFNTLAAHDAQLNAGTVVDVRALNRSFNVTVGSNYERLTDANALTFAQSTSSDLTRYETTSALAQLPGGSPEMLIPNYADVTSRGINAGLALPVNGRLTVGVGYGAQRLTGSYGTSFVPNLDANNTSYVGNITFALPRSSSAITLSARQNRYQDNLTPFSLQQTRADLNFTVKF
jgi:hypothetical protein